MASVNEEQMHMGEKKPAQKVGWSYPRPSTRQGWGVLHAGHAERPRTKQFIDARGDETAIPTGGAGTEVMF